MIGADAAHPSPATSLGEIESAARPARGSVFAFLARPGFQRWALRSPLTRIFARRSAASLFDLTAGFVYSQILLACIRLGLLELLLRGALPAGDIAIRIGLSEEAATRLCRAAAALGLIAPSGKQGYRLGLNGAALLGNPGVIAMVEHHALLYADLADPVRLLRQEGTPAGLGAFWPYAGSFTPESLPASGVGAYSALMAASNSLVADQVLQAYPIRRHRCLLDVGGGEGAFLCAAAAAAPALRLGLFDLPPVTQRARDRLDAAGLLPRTQLHAGNFLTDAIPQGADLITLVRVVHDHDDDAVAKLLRAVHRALPPGGRLLLAEPMAGSRHTARAADAYFGFYLLAMGSGRPRTPAELRALLRLAGFRRATQRRTAAPMLSGLIVADA